MAAVALDDDLLGSIGETIQDATTRGGVDEKPWPLIDGLVAGCVYREMGELGYTVLQGALGGRLHPGGLG